MAGRPRLRPGTHGRINSKKLASGDWEARCLFGDSDGHTREVSRRGRSRQEAEARLQESLGERPARVVGTFTGDTQLEKVAEDWFLRIDREAAEGTRAYGTVKNYRSLWRNHIAKHLAAVRCRDAENVPLINAYIVETKGRLSPGQMNIIKTVLNGVISHAMRYGAMRSNPMPAVERVPGAAKKEVQAMTIAQLTNWLEFLATWTPGLDPETNKPRCRTSQAKDLYEITLMMLSTGARISEILAVRIEDIDLSARTIVLDHRIVRVTGKGLQRVPRRGTKGAAVTLYLPDWALTVVRELKLRRGGNGPLFSATTDTGISAWRDPADVEKAILAARKDADLDHELTSHLYRRTVATQLDRADLPPEVIAAQLTHRTTRTTKASYIARRAIGDAAAQALEVFDPRTRGLSEG